MCTFVDRMVNLGIEQGIEQGEKQKEYEVICNMLQDNQSLEQISKYAGQPIAYITRIEKELEVMVKV